MRKLVFGSLNIDRTYRVKEFAQPGETISAIDYECFCGGKGFNQAIALARAGNEVYFAGIIGTDGDMLLHTMKQNGIRTDYLKYSKKSNGHAVIQIDESGQNCIIIVDGSNGEVTKEYVDEVLTHFEGGDLIVLQNEITNIDYIIKAAHAKGMIVAINPSPYNDKIDISNLNCVDYLLINEVEGTAITGCDNENDVLNALHQKYDNLTVVLTLGKRGSRLLTKDGKIEHCGVLKTEVKDSTAAGDTFTGYFLSEILKDSTAQKALSIAAVASGLSVSQKGAATSIPCYEDVIKMEGSL